MVEMQNTKEFRAKLYDDIWAEPMTVVATKYGVSDNGLRKRCKTLRIPIPPFGYWAKVKAGKQVEERPPLPTYAESVLNVENLNGIIELQSIEELSVEQLTNMHDLDLLTPSSIETFINWCDSITVPGRVNDYDNLVSKHKLEIEYRELRDKEHPFRGDGIRLVKLNEKVKYRDNEAVIPICVSNNQRSRAYRIVDTILKGFHNLKANFSIERGDKDNICMKLLSTDVSFEFNECKSVRRHLITPLNFQDLRPLYEEIYDGRLQINWQLKKSGYFFPSDRETPVCITYIDSDNNLLENQISAMILEIFKQCCNNKIKDALVHKERELKFEQERNDQLEQEREQKQRKREEQIQEQKDSLIKDIPIHSSNWFMHQQLNKYADELESYQATCTDEETKNLLSEYIALVRENANNCNPLRHILNTMKMINLRDDTFNG